MGCTTDRPNFHELPFLQGLPVHPHHVFPTRNGREEKLATELPALLVNVGDCSPTMAEVQRRAREADRHPLGEGLEVLYIRGLPSRTDIRLLAARRSFEQESGQVSARSTSTTGNFGGWNPWPQEKHVGNSSVASCFAER